MKWNAPAFYLVNEYACHDIPYSNFFLDSFIPPLFHCNSHPNSPRSIRMIPVHLITHSMTRVNKPTK